MKKYKVMISDCYQCWGSHFLKVDSQLLPAEKMALIRRAIQIAEEKINKPKNVDHTHNSDYKFLHSIPIGYTFGCLVCCITEAPWKIKRYCYALESIIHSELDRLISVC